jgi:PAS domain S-box-containing protein
VKADHEIERSIEAELADLRQQLAAANCRITELEAVKDRRKSAAALADTQEQIELIVDTLPVLLAYIDAEQRYLYVNRLYADWYGLAREEIIGKHVRDVLHEATYQRALPPIEGALRGQRITYENDAAYDVQGQLHTVRATYVPQLDENGRAKAFLAMVEDITERKRAEEALRESEHLLRMVADNIPALVSYLDQDRCYRFVNQRYAENFGRPVADMIGKPHRDVVGEAYYQATLNNVNAAFSGQRVSYETSIDFPEFGMRWLLVSYTPDVDELGHVKGIFIAAYDITKRKQAEKALQESEEKYRNLFEEALDAILVGSAETGVIIDCNRAATLLWGREKSELIGQHQRILHPPGETEGEFSRTFQQHLREKKGQVLEAQIVTKNGEIRDVEIMANVFELGGQGLVQGIFRDITERKQAEAQLVEQLDELRRWHAATLGREARVIDLKREVNELLAQAGQPPRYPSAEAEGQ